MDLSFVEENPEESQRGKLLLITHQAHAVNMKIQLLQDIYVFAAFMVMPPGTV